MKDKMTKIDSLTEETRKLGEQIEKLEANSRRSNLIINGIKEDKNESWEECEIKVKEVITFG